MDCLLFSAFSFGYRIYTSQDDVMKLQWRNLERALDLAERTKEYPEGSRTVGIRRLHGQLLHI